MTTSELHRRLGELIRINPEAADLPFYVEADDGNYLEPTEPPRIGRLLGERMVILSAVTDS